MSETRARKPNERALLIAGGEVVDPEGRRMMKADVLLEDGIIRQIEPGLRERGAGGEDAELINATGRLVAPGLVDMHVHLREPGYEYRETIESGALAAVTGGVTSVACMANTRPVNDCPSVTRFILDRAERAGLARVLPVGALSVGMKGKQLAEFAGMVEEGIVAVSDDGLPVHDAELMRRALECARLFDIPVLDHAEDPTLVAGGCMHEGAVSLRLGLQGIPAAAEDVMVARDIALAELTGAHLHICHMSSGRAVEIVRAAKASGILVTAEVSPHHLELTDEAVVPYRTDAKMAPPLRGAEDREALRAGLIDGTLDAIATDHAPHHRDEKDVEFSIAQNGVVGLETLLPLTLRLVEEGVLDLPTAIARVTSEPARILHLPYGRMAVGAPADIAIIDPELEWTVTRTELKSKGKNTPFKDWKMRGRALVTIVAGTLVHDARPETKALREKEMGAGS
ncbi:MAG: dihydroorotase [bacterium]